MSKTPFSDYLVGRNHVKIGNVVQKFISTYLQNTTSDSGLTKMLEGRVLSVVFQCPGSGTDDRCRILPELICGPSILKEDEMLRLQYALDDLVSKHPFITDKVLFALHELHPLPEDDASIMLQSAWLCGALQVSFEDLSIIAHLKSRIMQIAYSLQDSSIVSTLSKKVEKLFESCNCLTSIAKSTPEYMMRGIDAVVLVASTLQKSHTFSSLPLYWIMRLDKEMASQIVSVFVHTPYCSHFVYNTPGYQNSGIETSRFKFEMVGGDALSIQSTVVENSFNPPDWWLYATWSYFRRLIDCNVSIELAGRKLEFCQEVTLCTRQMIFDHLVFVSDRYVLEPDAIPLLEELELQDLIEKCTIFGGYLRTVDGISGMRGPGGC